MQSPQTNTALTRSASIPAPRPPSRDQAEAALIEHYPALVRLAYLILPPRLGRHRKVLAAHALVQRTLTRTSGLTHRGPSTGGPDGKGDGDRHGDRHGVRGGDREQRERMGEEARGPAATGAAAHGTGDGGPGEGMLAESGPIQSGSVETGSVDGRTGDEGPGDGGAGGAVTGEQQSRPDAPGIPPLPRPRTEETPARAARDWLRARVVRDALRPPLRVATGAALPKALGLRMFPRAGGTDELALDRALAAAEPATRAALALTALEGLAPAATLALLRGAGVTEPERAVREAERLRTLGGLDVAELLRRPEFDPCTVHLRPTDLLRRSRRVRSAALVAAVALVTGAAVGVLGDTPSAPAPPRTAVVSLPETWTPSRVPSEQWADTARVDFTAWPARGDRTGDRALIRRAMTAWTGGGPGPGAGSERPSLLYAGTVDGSAVVLLHTGRTLIRYTDPGSAAPRSGPGGDGPALVRTRADNSDVTTAAAVVLTRTGERTRYLLAPWIAEAGTRDLRAPASAPRPLRVSADGTTEPVPSPAAAGPCDAVPVLQLRSSRRIVEDHAFLVADLGDLVPAHLTWTPLPVPGEAARRPREAAGPLGLAAWSHSACSLSPLRGEGIRSVNRWEFAAQSLPEKAGRALWICSRADTWEGPGQAQVTLEVPGRSLPVTTVRPTAACGRFGQDVLAGAYWSAKPGGPRYLLAAGSRRVVGVATRGPVSARAPGPVLAVRADGPAPVRLTGRLPDGSSLPGWTTPAMEAGG
ncbi:hypothetical protein [Streptomyces sp. NPDC048659]|uniref:hypothetical protein n=1 Tax=Streptomyces sp. NPDC048659 TaxID=3155489 RepID=UPI0034454128